MQTEPKHSSPWPTAMTDLDPGERLVIWAFRCWASGTESRPMVRSEFHRRFAPRHAEAAMGAFEGLVDAIRGAACRVLNHHAPCCPCVGPDEMCVVTLVAASQERDADLAHAAVHCLVCSDAVERASAAAEALGDTLARHGLALPSRVRQAACPSASGKLHAAAPRVLH